MRFEEIRTQLQDPPMTRYQIFAVAIPMFVNMVDGFDLLAISREWLVASIIYCACLMRTIVFFEPVTVRQLNKCSIFLSGSNMKPIGKRRGEEFA